MSKDACVNPCFSEVSTKTTSSYSEKEGWWYVLVTGFPVRTRNSRLLQASPMFATSARDEMLLWDKLSIFKLGRLADRFFASRFSIKLPAQSKWLNRTSFGKLSRRVMRLLERSQQSNASLVAAPFSITGIPSPCRTSSRSSNGFVLCSARARSSAVILIISEGVCVIQSAVAKSMSVNARGPLQGGTVWGGRPLTNYSKFLIVWVLVCCTRSPSSIDRQYQIDKSDKRPSQATTAQSTIDSAFEKY